MSCGNVKENISHHIGRANKAVGRINDTIWKTNKIQNGENKK